MKMLHLGARAGVKFTKPALVFDISKQGRGFVLGIGLIMRNF